MTFAHLYSNPVIKMHMHIPNQFLFQFKIDNEISDERVAIQGHFPLKKKTIFHWTSVRRNLNTNTSHLAHPKVYFLNGCHGLF